MKTHELVQGTPEWHDHRLNHHNASDAPAMMGEDANRTRSQLIKELATGLRPEVSSFQQKIFDEGHVFEALARPMAEEIIGEELYPVTGSQGKYSASFDGLTMMEHKGFEHKELNEKLRAAMVPGCTGADLPLMYQIQMEQQCLVAEPEGILFVASSWKKSRIPTAHFVRDENGNVQYYELIDMRHCWYEPNLFLRKQIVDGWTQLEADVCAYQHVEVLPAPVATVIEHLPDLIVNLVGEVTSSTLPEFKAAAIKVISSINTNLVTDQHFADAENQIKFCTAGESKLEQVKSRALSQTATIEELFRTIDDLKEHLRAKRLELEGLVKKRKIAIRTEIVTDAREEFSEHIRGLNARFVQPYIQMATPDFATAIKNKRTISSLHDACDTLLAKSKIEATNLANHIEANLRHLTDVNAPMFLFSDLQDLVTKGAEYFAAVVKARMDKHAADEAEKLEAQRETIRLEELAKLQQESDLAAQQACAAPEDELIGGDGATAAVSQAATPAANQVFQSGRVIGKTASSFTSGRPRASTRAMVDNILNTLSEPDMQKVLSYLQAAFTKQAA